MPAVPETLVDIPHSPLLASKPATPPFQTTLIIFRPSGFVESCCGLPPSSSLSISTPYLHKSASVTFFSFFPRFPLPFALRLARRIKRNGKGQGRRGGRRRHSGAGTLASFTSSCSASIVHYFLLRSDVIGPPLCCPRPRRKTDPC